MTKLDALVKARKIFAYVQVNAKTRRDRERAIGAIADELLAIERRAVALQRDQHSKPDENGEE